MIINIYFRINWCNELLRIFYCLKRLDLKYLGLILNNIKEIKMKESFILRAKENLKAAEILYENELYNASANRAYYAAFHIAIASNYDFVKEFSIEHMKVRGLFCDLYINRRKILPSKYKEYLYDLQRTRNLADYGEGVSKNKAKTQFKMSKEFVELLIGVLNNENES